MSLSSRMNQIAPFRVMDILARARHMQDQGRDLVHMEVGEPDFAAPSGVIEAVQKALTLGQTHYTPATGLPQLREAIAAYYRDRFGVVLSPQRIIVTPGASGALQLVLSVLVNPDDEVLVQDPGYPCNRNMIALLGGVPRSLPPMSAGFDATTAAASFGEKTKAVMLATPANPTGEVIPAHELNKIYQQIRKAGSHLIVDEIYQGLQYEGEPRTALSMGDDRLFVINSFSKFFGMTGFRVGWAVVPEWAVEAMDRLAQNLFLAAPTPSQYGALAAFDEENLVELERRRLIFKTRRDLLFSGLNELGFALGPKPPAGAFYLYAGLEGLAEDGLQLSEDLLAKAGVAITPGLDFGQHQANQHVRFAYTTDVSRLETGLKRLGDYLSTG